MRARKLFPAVLDMKRTPYAPEAERAGAWRGDGLASITGVTDLPAFLPRSVHERWAACDHDASAGGQAEL